MHRIDTPTAQADKFGPGKNGFTNGDPSTGRRATDLNSDMWDAVQEEICAVIEQSGLALDKNQHDQLYKAIVKIITSKIPDALLKKNNLSDLADKALARANLQLKTAAQKDIVTSTTDTTVDRVPVVGWQGLGSATQFRMGQVSQFLAYPSADLKEVPANGAGWQSAYGASRRAQAFMNTSGIFYSRFSLSDVALDVDTPWAIHYTTLNKPEAKDCDAVSATNGGTFQKSIIVKGNGASITIQPLTDQQASYLLGKGYNGGNTWYVGRGGANNNVALYNYQGLNGLVLAEDGSIGINPAQGKPLQLGSVGSAILNIGDNDSGLRSSVDGQVDLWSNSTMVGYWNKTTFSYSGQIIPTNYANFDNRYYTKAQSDAGYMPKTGAYTKAESDGRYQPKGSYGKPDSYQVSGNILWTKNGDTNVIRMTGQVGTTSGGARITFPFAFASKCYSVHINAVASSGAGTALAAYNINTTGFNLQIAGGGSVALSWTAEGI